MTTRRGFIRGVSSIGATALLTSALPLSQARATPTIAGVPTPKAKEAILAINIGMRSNYAALKADLVQHLSPVIVVQNNATGGKFTLVTNGARESVEPVPQAFELAKSIAHVPLGCYSIVASYLADSMPGVPNESRIDPHDLKLVAFNDEHSRDWILPLQDFGSKLETARRVLPEAGLVPELQKSCYNILTGGIDFISNSVKTKKFGITSFQAFAGNVYPDIRVNMKYASEAQIAGVKTLMGTWRKKLGESAWADLYTVVLSQWTTAELNKNTIIIKDLMNPAKVDTHLIDLPGLEMPADPVAVALDNLARIVQDNIAAELIFSQDTNVADALKGKQDLLSEEILVQLGTGTRVRSALPDYNTTTKGVCPVKK
ncbi:hypothetical protein ACTAQJ_10400 [Arthrobacter sp. alpha11c]